MNPKRTPLFFIALIIMMVGFGSPLRSNAQTSDVNPSASNTELIPRPVRAAYPPRPRLAMITVASIQPWADKPGVDQMEAWLEVAQLSAGLDNKFDLVERTQLDLAATELAWSVVADDESRVARSARSAMSIGRWVGCDLLLIAEARGDRPTVATDDLETTTNDIPAVPRLHLTVIDPTTATRLATTDQPLAFPTPKPTASDIDRLAAAIRTVVETADAKRRAADNKPVAMLLHFRNLSRNDRLDRLNVEVPELLQRLAEADQSFRMVQVAEPRSSLAEQEMLLAGLLEADPDSWATAADVYLWGSVRELSATGDDDGEPLRGASLGSDPQTVPIELSLVFWNGQDDPQAFTQQTSADQIDTVIETLVQRVSAQLSEPLPPTVSTTARRKAAYLLAGDVMGQRRVPNFRHDDPIDGWRARQFFYGLNTARAARFLDARDPALARAAVALGHPEWASDPWAGFLAYTADLDQAIRLARSPVIQTREWDAVEAEAWVSDRRADEAFYDLVERRIVTLLVETFAVLGERTGDRVEHDGEATEYTPPRLPGLTSLSDAERRTRMARLIGEAEALGREYARWKADVRVESKPEAENEFAGEFEMRRRLFEETQTVFEESLLTDLTRLFTAHRDGDPAQLSAAIDRWLPVIRLAVASENGDALRVGSSVSPAEDWPELHQLADRAGHQALLEALRPPATAEASRNPPTVDPSRPTQPSSTKTTAAASDGWLPVKIKRVKGEADASPPIEIAGFTRRSRNGRLLLRLETRDADGGETSYRWEYRPPREARQPAASRQRPVAPIADLPKKFNAADTKRWLAAQQEAGKLQGGVLQRNPPQPKTLADGSKPGSRMGHDPRMMGWRPRPRTNPYAWVKALPSLPADMPPQLAALLKAKGDAPPPAMTAEEVRSENRRRRAMGYPLLEETVKLPDHAEGPVVKVHHLRVRVAGHKMPWPIFRPEETRPDFGPLRWVHGWLASPTFPAASDNPRGGRYERGRDAHRDLRWLHPVSLADRYPGFELPDDTLVTDIAEASEDGGVWVATYGRGLLRIQVDPDRQRTQQQSFTTRHGLIDQRVYQLLRVGDRLVAFGGGGVSILSDLGAKRPTIRDASLDPLRSDGGYFAVGPYVYLTGSKGGWWHADTGEMILLKDWLQENLAEPFDVIGGFVQGDRSWVILTDRMICIESDLQTHRSLPLRVPAHRSLMGVADRDTVWLAYPDPMEYEPRVVADEVSRPWRHYDPSPLLGDSNAAPPRTASRLAAIHAQTGELLGQTAIEGQVQQLAVGGGELFVASPTGLWDVSVFDCDQVLTAMSQFSQTPPHASDPAQTAAQRQTFVPDTMPLIRAAVVGEVETMAGLLADGTDAIDHADPVTGLWPLLAAVRYGHLEIVEQLLAAGADPQIKSEVTPWIRPLMMSAMRNDAEIFSTLVEHGAIRRGHNQRLGTEVHAAVLHKSYDVLEALPISSSLDRFAKTPRVVLVPAKGNLTLKLKWFTPMLLAVERGDARAVAALVEAGHRVCSPGAREDEEFISPLCLAASVGRGDLLRLMLANPRTHWHAEDHHHGDNFRNSPWDYAVWFDQPEAIRAMLDCGVKPPADPDLLLVAARAGALPLLERLHQAGLDMNHVWKRGQISEYTNRPNVGERARHMTVLTTAVSHGHHRLVASMVERFGLELDADLAGDTQRDLLLRVMLERGDLMAAIDLVAAGANVDGATFAYSPATLLSVAAERGEIEAVEFLLRLGADPRTKGRDGRNALRMADKPEVKALLESVSR